LKLILRTKIPDNIPSDIKKIIKHKNITIIDYFLEENEWKDLKQKCDFYLIPAARVHIVSILDAMSYGMVVIASDGWGFEEIIENYKTGIIIKGREHISYIDAKSGFLKENYSDMYVKNKNVIRNCILSIEQLMENPDLVKTIKHNAIKYINENHSFNKINYEYMKVFDNNCIGGIKKLLKTRLINKISW